DIVVGVNRHDIVALHAGCFLGGAIGGRIGRLVGEGADGMEGDDIVPIDPDDDILDTDDPFAEET
ncbi:MAG: hypothetical protein AAFV49_17215, partial [Pseudomonadota bacterium]